MEIATLGPALYDSPSRRCISEQARIPAHVVRDPSRPAPEELLFELAGPRRKMYFNPQQTRAAIVTCGGLCPGLNNVIRSLFLELHHMYGVKEVLGFRGGYIGLDPASGQAPVVLDAEMVDDIHREGGTILGTSRGPVDVRTAIDNLVRKEVNMLFTIGGDGTQRGANDLCNEANRRGYKLAVVGVPKTIDNDIPFVARSFGYLTAVEEAARVLQCAHMEAHSVVNGISIVKLMGREAGFIAAGATVASQDVNFTLIPEVAFKLHGEHGFLPELKKRVLRRSHALIVVAEGAGQDLLQHGAPDIDASGNRKLKDIGLFLRHQVEEYFKAEGVPVVLRYFDPSYVVRSVPADSEDAILCDLYARNAVHAAMAGKTRLIIGALHDKFIHVPIELALARKRRLNPCGSLWSAVLAATGQAAVFE